MVLKKYRHPFIADEPAEYYEVESKKEFFACKLCTVPMSAPGFKRLSQDMNGKDMHILAEFESGEVWLLSVVHAPADQKTIHRWLPER